MAEDKNIKKDEKWDFSDYAFTITGILVGVLLVGPEIFYNQFGISILGGSLSDVGPGFAEERLSLNELRALSPMLFLLTTTIVYFEEAYTARKTGGYKGSLFTHTFESLFEEAIYMAITTVMVYAAVLNGTMYMSWLAGPISWILFVFIFPLVRKKDDDLEKSDKPWLLLVLFAAGLVAEIITGAWIAFPVTWLIICMVKMTGEIREYDRTPDSALNIMYYAFSIIMMAVGVGLGMWLTSWAAFPIALFVCWVLSKVGVVKAR